MGIKNGRTDTVFREGRSNLNRPLQRHGTVMIARTTSTGAERADGRKFQHVLPDECCISAPHALERKEIISLVERMARLPDTEKGLGDVLL